MTTALDTTVLRRRIRTRGSSEMEAPKSGTDWLKSQTRRISEGGALPVDARRAAAMEVERWLQGREVHYAPPTAIPLDLIDERRSRKNQARQEAIVTESVERFSAAMRGGDVFPPIVVFAEGGKLIIIDGNNRQAAAKKAGRDTIDGIIIAADTPGELIQLLTVEANARHGVTPDPAWRLHQAVYLTSIGHNADTAAAVCGVSPSAISNYKAIQQAERRADALRINGFTALPVSHRLGLARIKDDPVFYQAAKLVISTGMTQSEVGALLRHFRALASEGARIDYIGSLAKEREVEAAVRKATGKAAARVSSPKTGLVTGIGMLLKVDPAALIRQIVTSNDRDLITARVKQLEDKLLEIQVAMDSLKDLGD